MKKIKKRHGHPDFYKILGEMADLHETKSKDYAKDGDPLGNFNRVSAVLKVWGFDIPPELVGLIYMLKQLDCAMWMLSQGYEGEMESFDKRLEDVGIYAPLNRILARQKATPPALRGEYAEASVMCSRCKRRPAKLGRKRCSECLEHDRLYRETKRLSPALSKAEEPGCDAPGYCARCSAPLIDDEQGKCSACLAA